MAQKNLKPIGAYMFPFDNARQVNKVLKELKNIFK